MGDSQMCVVCRARPIEPRWRPFCSERCRNEDLARWSDERYRVASDTARPSDAAPDDED